MAAPQARVEFSDEHKALVASAFRVVDAAGAGRLAYEDMFNLLRMLMVNEGVASTDAALEHGCRRGFEAIDTDGDGFIQPAELEEFVRTKFFDGTESDEEVTAKLRALLDTYREAIDIPPPPPLDAHPDDIPPPPAEELEQGLNSDVDGDGEEDPGSADEA